MGNEKYMDDSLKLPVCCALVDLYVILRMDNVFQVIPICSFTMLTFKTILWNCGILCVLCTIYWGHFFYRWLNAILAEMHRKNQCEVYCHVPVLS